MSEAVTIFVCKTSDDRDKAVGFLKAHGYSAANMTIDQVTTISYDAKTFCDPSAGKTDITTGYVVIGAK